MKQSKPYVNCFRKVLTPKSTNRPIIYFFGGGGGGLDRGENDDFSVRAIIGGQTVYTKCNKCAINGMK